VLEQAPEAMADRELLLELAKVIDSGAQSGLVAIQTQTSCDTTGALWGLLARSDTMPSDQLNAFAVVRHFSAFPTHLRHHLGPPIAEKLMDMGEYESALQVRNAILRGSQGDGPQMMMLQARIDQMDGNEPEANRNFAAVAISRSEQAALALTQLIENEVTADKIISDDLLDQAMALVSEFDVSATAFSLPKAIIAALVQQLKFQEAFGQINEFRERGQLDEEMAQVLWARSLEKLITDADDVTFMTNAVTQMRADAVDDPVRLAIAARLVELQLPGPARVALGTRADIPSDQERYILAKIAILEGKRSVAMSYLTGLNSDQAISLRILADEITISDQQLEIAGDDIAASFEPSRPQEVSDVVSEGTLARSQQLIDQTKEMRDSLLVLLREQQN